MLRWELARQASSLGRQKGKRRVNPFKRPLLPSRLQADGRMLVSVLLWMVRMYDQEVDVLSHGCT